VREINNKDFTPLNWAEGHLETASLMIRHNGKWISPALNAFMAMAGEFYSNSTNP
jgi:hypothetical protein